MALSRQPRRLSRCALFGRSRQRLRPGVHLHARASRRLAAAGRSDLQALHFGGVGLGIALSAATIAALVAEQVGLAGRLAGGRRRFRSPASPPAGAVRRGPLRRRPPGAEGGALPRSPALIKLILAYGLFGFGYIVTATFLVAIVRQGGGSRLFEAAVWMVTGLAGLPSVWLWST